METLQSNQVVSRKTTKRIADESNELSKKNTSSAVVPPVSLSASHKPAGHVPASIRNIHRLSTMDHQMTNGGRYSDVLINSLYFVSLVYCKNWLGRSSLEYR